MTFCPEEMPAVFDPTENASSTLGDIPSEMSTASEPEASAPGASWDLAARPPNCS